MKFDINIIIRAVKVFLFIRRTSNVPLHTCFIMMYVPISLIEKISLPGMMPHTLLITRQREKAKKINEKINESNPDFEENIDLIEMQATTKLPANESGNLAQNEVRIVPKKRGRKKKETLPTHLEKSPDVAKTQILRKS